MLETRRWRLSGGGIGLLFSALILANPVFALNTDHDQDGLSDNYEAAIGTDPYCADTSMIHCLGEVDIEKTACGMKVNAVWKEEGVENSQFDI